MPWTCEYCGWENSQDDRIGRKEPQCIRCNHRRGERMKKIQTLEFTIERIRAWDREYAEKIECLNAKYDSLWAGLDQIGSERDRLVRERHENALDLENKKKRLEALTAINPARQPAEDQRTLRGVQD